MRPTVDAVAPGAYPLAGSRVGRFRWVICALLFFITTINYMDRQVIGVLKPVLAQDICTGARSTTATSSSSSSSPTPPAMSGWAGSWTWSGSGSASPSPSSSGASPRPAHGLARSAFGFGLARFLLGIGEGGNFPAAIKTVSNWFPVKERALRDRHLQRREQRRRAADAAARALDRPSSWGWPAAFYATGLIGFIWLAFWLLFYRNPEEHPRLSRDELAYIRSDPEIPAKKSPGCSSSAIAGPGRSSSAPS